jgi:hypothetical protein
LHLRHGPAGPETDIRANLPATLADLAQLMPEPAAAALHAAHDHVTSALQAFPDRPVISTALVAAAQAIEMARTSAGDELLRTHGYRLERKLVEIDAALLLTQGINPIAWAEPHRLHAGESAVLRVQLDGDTTPVTATAVAGDGISIGSPDKDGPSLRFSLATTPTAPLSDQFLPGFASLGGNGQVRIAITATIEGRSATTMLDLEEALTIAPSHTGQLQPSTVIVNRASPVVGATEIKLADIAPSTSLVLQSPIGWRVDRTTNGFAVTPPADLLPGRYRLPVLVDGHPAFSDQAIAYPHIGRTHFVMPLALNLLALDLELPANTSVGYVGGGSDRVGYWLKAIGLDVTDLDDAALAGDLSRFTSIVIGTFAFGQRPALRQHIKKLHAWVASGGHLLTLYHRPSDGWDPQATPPKRIKIGSPSLRWRVTNPAAEVSTLLTNSPLLSQPNVIGPDDWSGWDKERGLYFAAEWDPAYQALLAMSDVGEAPLQGALISAKIGTGRHTHTSLVLHHQLDKLVPGAFRLMANLVQPA